MGFDHRRLRTGELVAGACALLLFIDMFVSWYGLQIGGQVDALANAQGVSTTASAWKVFTFTDLWMLLLILVTLGLIALTAAQRSPALPVAGSVVVTVLAGLVTLLVLYRIVQQPGPNDFISVEFGAYLGFLLCAGIAIGGFLSMRDEGTTLSGARAQAESMIAERRTPGGGAATTTGSTASPPAGTTPRPPPAGPPDP